MKCESIYKHNATWRRLPKPVKYILEEQMEKLVTMAVKGDKHVATVPSFCSKIYCAREKSCPEAMDDCNMKEVT